jgi:hypothetical protein
VRSNIKRGIGIEEERRGWKEPDQTFFPPLSLSFLFGGARERKKIQKFKKKNLKRTLI